MFLAGLFCLLTAGEPAIALSHDDEEAALRSAESSVVRVSIVEVTPDGLILKSYGSGFVVSPGVVATNFHVVRSLMDEGEVLRSDLFAVVTPAPGFNDKPIRARLRWFYPDPDLALLEAPGLTAPALTLTDSLPGKTDRVRALGFPGDTDDMLAYSADDIIRPRAPFSTAGTIALFSDRSVGGGQVPTIFHTAGISRGNSGGPLVDACGRLIGVNTWAGGRRVDDTGFVAASSGQYVATQLGHLKAMLRERAIPFAADDIPCELGKAQGSDRKVQEQLDQLKSQLSAATADAEAQRRASKAAEAARSREQALQIGLAGALALGAGGWVVVRRRQAKTPRATGGLGVSRIKRGPSPVIILATCAILALAAAAVVLSAGG